MDHNTEPSPRPGTEGEMRSGELDKEGRARAIASDQLAAKHGLIFNEPTLYAWGTVGQWGQKAARARADLRKRPLAHDLIEIMKETVAKECRLSNAVEIGKLRYAATDRIHTDGSNNARGAAMSPQALSQLLARLGAPPYSAGYLGHEKVTGALRAPHVSHWIGAADQKRKLAFLTKLSASGDRGVYAVVGSRYVRYDMDRVLGDLADVLPATSRGEVHYDASTNHWRADFAIGAEFEPVVGDIHRLNLRVGGADAGQGSIYVYLTAERARCLNFTKVRGKSGKTTVRHVGKPEEVAMMVREMLTAKGAAMAEFAEQWREANETALIDSVSSDPDGDARKVFGTLIDNGYVTPSGKRDDAVDHFFNAWLKEPGQTRADYVNAITRAAHEAPWTSPWVTEELESQAGDLLYNRVVLQRAQIEVE